MLGLFLIVATAQALGTSPAFVQQATARFTATQHASIQHASTQQRAAPPPNSLEQMARPIRLGRDQGFTAYLTPMEIIDQRFHPFLVRIKLTAESNLGLQRIRFVTEFGEFESEIAKADLPKLAGPAFGDTRRPSNSAILKLKRVEDRSFNIDTDQAVWLAETGVLEVTMFGPLRERHFRLSKKALARLQKWLLPRLDKYRE